VSETSPFRLCCCAPTYV